MVSERPLVALGRSAVATGPAARDQVLQPLEVSQMGTLEPAIA